MSIRAGLKKTGGRVRVQAVDVSEWRDDIGTDTLHVRRMSVDERNEVEASKFTQTGRGKTRDVQINMRDFRTLVLAKAICEADGARVYGDAPSDLAEVRSIDGVLGDKLFDAALEINGMKQSDADGEGEGEEKNSSRPKSDLPTG